MTALRVGQKVVYIGPDERINPYDLIAPAPGVVYTIRALRNLNYNGEGLLLREIKNKDSEQPGFIGVEYGFLARHFRPVVERKTDISCLSALLVPGTKIRETTS